jgi:hypothetical protein
MPIRATTVDSDPTFISNVDGLRGTYPAIDEVLAEFCEVLKLGYDLPEIGIGNQVYTRLVDYPPMGSAGFQRFSIVFHATDPKASWTEPYQSITLLAIYERRT